MLRDSRIVRKNLLFTYLSIIHLSIIPVLYVQSIYNTDVKKISSHVPQFGDECPLRMLGTTFCLYFLYPPTLLGKATPIIR